VPTGATYTREDGIVMVNDALCIGCNSCAVACPYDQRTSLAKDLFKNGLFGEGKITDFEKQGYTGSRPAPSASAISAVNGWTVAWTRPAW